jgi:hypothetical protein
MQKLNTMKNFRQKTLHTILVLCLLFGGSTITEAQRAAFSEDLKEALSGRQSSPTEYNGREFMAVSIEKLPNTATLNALGMELLEYMGGKYYIASVPVGTDKHKLSKYGIQRMAGNLSGFKTTLPLYKGEAPGWARANNNEATIVAVEFYTLASAANIESILKSVGFEAKKDAQGPSNVKIGTIGSSHILELAAHPLVSFVDAWQGEDLLLNKEVSTVTKSHVLKADFNGGRKLSGMNVAVGVGDGGSLGKHLDFGIRNINLANGTYSSFGSHGDHVSGIIGGGGTVNPRNAGMAPQATIISQKTSNIISFTGNYTDLYDMVLTNNSYGASSTCDSYGQYNYTSQNLDWQMRSYPEVLHIFAAGNDGGATCGSYPAGYANILRAYATAKNVLTVGSVKDNGTISGFSGKGPVVDGRIKPEVCGVGEGVVSTGRNYDYYSSSGTSMATPSVTGTLALLVERYRQLNNGQNPNNALLKAIVCNTAEDKGNPGPDYAYGFGIINALRAAETMEKSTYFMDNISDNQTKQHVINVPSGAAQLKIMLYWNDKEAAAYPDQALVNDLNLAATAPNGSSYQPWVLDRTPANVALPATRGEDNLNNIEQITIDNPASGNYTIAVFGKNFPLVDVTSQDYVVVYEIIMPQLRFTFPNGDERLLPNTDYLLAWEATDGDAGTFRLEYSTNGGASWTLINDNIASDERTYVWKTPNAYTANVSMRLTRNGSVRTCYNNLPMHVLAAPNLALAPYCNTKIQMSWTAVEGAASYEPYIYNRTSGQWKSLGTTNKVEFLADDPMILQDSNYWFSVQAIDANNKRSEMAIAKVITTPTNMACTLKKDVRVKAIANSETTGREMTSSALLAQTPITVQVSNEGSEPVWDVPVTLSINGTTRTEYCTDTIPANGTLSYTFAQKFDFSLAGVYDVDAWTELDIDENLANDSILNILKFKQLANKPASFPNFININALSEATYTGNNMGLNGLDKLDFESSNNATLTVSKPSGATEINIASLTQNGAVSLDVSSLILTANLANQTDQKIIIALHYKTDGDVATTYSLWARGNDQAAWTKVTDLSSSADWVDSENFNITTILNTKGQALGTSTQLKIEQTGTGTLSIGNITMENGGDLPVELAYFRARKYPNNDVQLQWRTESELNNKHFEIQLTKNAQDLANGNFRTIAYKLGRGTTTEPTNYEYWDLDNNKMGTYYYRLKQVDTDGTYTYSPLVAVAFDSANNVQLLQNPVRHHEIRLAVSSVENGHLRGTLYNAAGQVVRVHEQQLLNGGQEVVFPLQGGIMAGSYFLLIEQNNTNAKTLKVQIIE